MATAYELDLMNNVEISPGWCPLCGDPWEACLCTGKDLNFATFADAEEDEEEDDDFWYGYDEEPDDDRVCPDCGEVFEECDCEHEDWEES